MLKNNVKIDFNNKTELKNQIVEELKSKGHRITFQRRLILDTILSNETLMIKEVYYNVRKKDRSIGLATVYRFIKILQEAGIIDENEKFTFANANDNVECGDCSVTLQNGEVVNIDCCELYSAVKNILVNKGYNDDLKIDSINTTRAKK
ncbi:Fur family transcriptional regulator [Peptacetobacter sp.]|uniref:Fur family transcriptional regulator n=1 Tax=unclassified Peptacetobacter TaxID=2991974 RepID=UPI0026384E9C|nr:transcriptional repressor [Peptacetobacter sp.]MEE0451867.1 transcriptional repressor [Peptacetobacter sp.]